MLLCDETISHYPAYLFESARIPQLVVATAKPKKETLKPELPASVMAKVGSVEIPKNKAARRRLAQSIRDNVDKIKKATEMKKKGKPLSNDLQRAIKKVVK